MKIVRLRFGISIRPERKQSAVLLRLKALRGLTWLATKLRVRLPMFLVPVNSILCRFVPALGVRTCLLLTVLLLSRVVVKCSTLGVADEVLLLGVDRVTRLKGCGVKVLVLCMKLAVRLFVSGFLSVCVLCRFGLWKAACVTLSGLNRRCLMQLLNGTLEMRVIMVLSRVIEQPEHIVL